MQGMSLLTQVYGLLAFSMLVFTGGAALGRNGQLGTVIFGAIAYIGLGVAVPYLAEHSNLDINLLLGLFVTWVLVSGLFCGPMIAMVRKENGWRPVVLAGGSTSIVLVGATYMSIGMGDPSAWMKPLAGFTFIFLCVSLIAAFIGMRGRLWDLVTGAIGACLASAFILGYSAVLMQAHAAGDTSTRTAIKIAAQLWSAILWLFIEFMKIYSK